jgi:hypothetical protein
LDAAQQFRYGDTTGHRDRPSTPWPHDPDDSAGCAGTWPPSPPPFGPAVRPNRFRIVAGNHQREAGYPGTPVWGGIMSPSSHFDRDRIKGTERFSRQSYFAWKPLKTEQINQFRASV